MFGLCAVLARAIPAGSAWPFPNSMSQARHTLHAPHPHIRPNRQTHTHTLVHTVSFTNTHSATTPHTTTHIRTLQLHNAPQRIRAQFTASDLANKQTIRRPQNVCHHSQWPGSGAHIDTVAVVGDVGVVVHIPAQ